MDKLQEGASFKFRDDNGIVSLHVEAVFGTGRVGWAKVAIAHGNLVVNQSEERNPAIPLERIKELIKRYEALQAKKVNGHTD